MKIIGLVGLLFVVLLAMFLSFLLVRGQADSGVKPTAKLEVVVSEAEAVANAPSLPAVQSQQYLDPSN